MKTATRLYLNRACTLAACLGMSLMGITAAQAAPRRVVLPSGSVIPVRLDQSLSSKTAHSGDRFTATVRYGKDDAGLPEGTRMEGVISEVVRAADGKPGVLDMDFRRMVTQGGQVHTLTGSLVSLDAKSVKRSESGRLVASTDKGKDRLKWIGIGAGAGLLAGVLTKGNKLTDILLGAAAGYAYNEFANKPKPGDVNLKSGTDFGIRLDRQFAFDTNRPDYYRASANERLVSTEDDRYYRPDAQESQQNRDTRDEGRNNRDYNREATDDIGMLIDDRNVAFGGTKPYMRGSVVYVPLDTVARAGSFDYTYDSGRRTIYARNRALRLGLHSRIAVLNGERFRMPASPEMRSGKLYVPAQFIGLVTGGSVHWDADRRTVVLTTRGDNAIESGGDIGMQIDDRDVSFGNAKPFMRNGISFVPLDPVAKAANFGYSYNAHQRIIHARNGALRMGIGSRNAFFNGDRRRLNAAPEMRYGAVYVPMQFVNMATGGTADWDAGSRTVVLTTERAR